MTDHDQAAPAGPAADDALRPEAKPALRPASAAATATTAAATVVTSNAATAAAPVVRRRGRAGRPERHRRFDWRAIRAAYESGLRSAAELAADYGVSRTAIKYHRTREGWAEPAPAPRLGGNDGDRIMLVLRLFRMVDAQIGEIERRLKDADGSGPDEKDARTLAALARTIELLIDLEAKTRPETPAGPEEGDEDAFRTELARRIRGLSGEA